MTTQIRPAQKRTMTTICSADPAVHWLNLLGGVCLEAHPAFLLSLGGVYD